MILHLLSQTGAPLYCICSGLHPHTLVVKQSYFHTCFNNISLAGMFPWGDLYACKMSLCRIFPCGKELPCESNQRWGDWMD